MKPKFASGTLWKHADFLKLWSAQAVSSFGARITREGLPLAAVLTIHAEPAQLGLLAALSLAPGILVGLFAGGFVDRARKRSILIVADLIRAAILITVPAAAWFHWLTVGQLYGVAALVGGASALFDIADHAYLPSLVGRDRLMEGNSKLSMTESVAEIGGPALAGVLVQALTAPIAIVVNAATYVISALFLGMIGASESVGEHLAARMGWRGDLKAAFSVVWNDRHVRPLFLIALNAPLFGSFFSALYVVFAIRALGFSPALLGVTIAVGGVGALFGSVMAQPLNRSLGIGPAFLFSSGVSAASALLIPLASGPLAVRMGMMMTAQLLGDSFGVIAIVSAATLRQSLLPRAILGRSAALFQAAAGTTAVIGALAGGVLGGLIGVRLTLLIAACAYVAQPLIGLASPLRSLRELPEPANTATP